MPAKVSITGGPADGMDVSPGDRYAWLDVVVLKRSEPRPTAGLYELTPAGYCYVGGHKAPCACGGAMVARDEDGSRRSCPVCGDVS